MEFQDFNFKLAVINELMYVQEILVPKFDVYAFAKEFKDRKIDIESEGYGIITEVKEYFEKLEIPKKYSEKVEEIFQDGGNEIYMQLYPFWDGEDDIFNIKSAIDSRLFSKLKNVTLFYDENDAILKDFEHREISAEWL